MKKHPLFSFQNNQDQPNFMKDYAIDKYLYSREFVLLLIKQK